MPGHDMGDKPPPRAVGIGVPRSEWMIRGRGAKRARAPFPVSGSDMGWRPRAVEIGSPNGGDGGWIIGDGCAERPRSPPGVSRSARRAEQTGVDSSGQGRAGQGGAEWDVG